MDHKQIVICACALLLPQLLVAGDKRPYTDQFPTADCQFINDNGSNPYFILQVGRTATYNNDACVTAGACDEAEQVVIAVTGDTHVVDTEDGPVVTRVVMEHETVDGELLEISRNYFAECAQTGDVYYFGESVDIYEDCEIKDPVNFSPPGCVSHEGAWEAGVAGARAGLAMSGGAFLLGARYMQETAPDVAMDRAEHVAMNLDIDVPAGAFDRCVQVLETTPLDKKSKDSKYYCPGVGLVIDAGVELVSVLP